MTEPKPPSGPHKKPSMFRAAAKRARWLLAAGVCFAFTAHCGGVTISQGRMMSDFISYVPGVGGGTKTG
jgi:hypothetical protein